MKITISMKDKSRIVLLNRIGEIAVGILHCCNRILGSFQYPLTCQREFQHKPYLKYFKQRFYRSGYHTSTSFFNDLEQTASFQFKKCFTYRSTRDTKFLTHLRSRVKLTRNEVPRNYCFMN